MAIQYQVNIAINAGCDFRQEFTLAEADRTPLDITGATFVGGLAKHPNAQIAYLSTSEEPVYNIVQFTTGVVDGGKGVYFISLTADQTCKLQEGKYVYNVVRNSGGFITEVVSGLAFVETSLAGVLSK